MRVSVIVLAWNGMEHLDACLRAVLGQDCQELEVLVVDNGSTDGSADFVAAHFPAVLLIRNETNLGYAAGNNVGLKRATGDILVLLNQDTIVMPGWLHSLVETLRSDPAIGIAGSKALYPNGSLQHAGGAVNERGEGRHPSSPPWLHQCDEGIDVDYVSGASLAISRTALNAIGTLDEEFGRAYFEDIDWCYSAWERGFRVVYAPASVLVHKEGGGKRTSHTQEDMYVFHRNRLRFVLKHWSFERFVEEFVPEEIQWLEHLREGSETMIAAVHRAYQHHLLDFHEVLDLRARHLKLSSAQRTVLLDHLIELRAFMPLGPARIGDISIAAEGRMQSGSVSPAEPSEEGMEGTDLHPAPPEDSGERDRNADAGPRLIFSVDHANLARLHDRWSIQEPEFHSSLPVIGPLVAFFRTQWSKIAAKWYVLSMFQQQIECNALIVSLLNELVSHTGELVACVNEQHSQLQGMLLHGQRLEQEIVALRTDHGHRLGECEQAVRQVEYDRGRLGVVLAEYTGDIARTVGDLATRVADLRRTVAESSAQMPLKE